MSPLQIHGGQSAGGTATPTARVLLNVERAAGDLEQMMNELAGAVAHLEDVASPLLGVTSEKMCSRPDRPKGESEHAERILRLKDEVENLTFRIQSVIAGL